MLPEEKPVKSDAEILTDILLKNICYQLSQRNWSLKMLADESELPYETVKKLINGKIRRPSFISILQIANALDCSIDSLAGRKDPAAEALKNISENANEIFRILSDMDHLLESPALKNGGNQ